MGFRSANTEVPRLSRSCRTARRRAAIRERRGRLSCPTSVRAVSIPVVDSGDDCRRGTQQAEGLIGQFGELSLQKLPQPGAHPEHPRLVGAGGGQHQDVPKGRLVPQAAQLDLLLIEAVIVLAGGETDDVVVRGVGLDHRSPPLLPAAARPTTWVIREKVRSRRGSRRHRGTDLRPPPPPGSHCQSPALWPPSGSQPRMGTRCF